MFFLPKLDYAEIQSFLIDDPLIWHTLNLRALYELDENFLFTVSLENISNKLYRPYSSGISAPGTNFIFSINYRL